MPKLITGNPYYTSVNSERLKEANFDYNYPFDLDLKPGSDLHEKLKTKILDRARLSADVMQGRFDSWNAVDKKMTAYIRTDDEEDDVVDDDDRKPVSIVFPYSYAIIETLMSYMVAAFFQDPIFMYEGASPEDILGAILMEKVIDQQCIRNKVALTLHTNFRDAFCYGLAPVVPYWHIDRGKRISKRAITSGLFGNLFGRNQFEKVISDDVILFEGNGLRNVDPYKYLPDPDVPVHEVQKGEYAGWVEETRYINLLEDEYSDPSMFNVKYCQLVNHKRTSIFNEDDSARNERTGNIATSDKTLTQVDTINMYVKLVPKEWRLHGGEKPEKWLFTLACDEVIIKAKPLGLAHNKFPIGVSAPDFDGYSCTPISRFEMLSGMQGLLDWLFNSHIANVRKAINDTLIVDPYLLNLNDLRKPRPGGIVRLRRPVWGRGVQGAYEQLKVTDITQGHMADSQLVMHLMDIAGASDKSTAGMLRQSGPERLTAEEYQGTRTGAVSRLERMARVIGLQLMQDIGYMFASHVQQLMSQEVYVNTVGRWRDELIRTYGIKGQRVKVDPMDLLIDYDLKIRDGSIPGGNFSKIWVQLFQAVIKQPELAQTFDIVRIFKHIARNMGAKDVESFVRRPNVQGQLMPDDKVENQVQQGNLIPFPAQGGGYM